VGLRIAAGLLPAKDLAATLRYWIGDVIGILVLTPFALFALTRRRILPMSTETALQCAAIVGALVIVFGFAEEREFQLFYVLFLPIRCKRNWDSARRRSVTNSPAIQSSHGQNEHQGLKGDQLFPFTREELHSEDHTELRN
jgi:hypothetical protein